MRLTGQENRGGQRGVVQDVEFRKSLCKLGLYGLLGTQTGCVVSACKNAARVYCWRNYPDNPADLTHLYKAFEQPDFKCPARLF